MTPRYWLHVDPAQASAHLLALTGLEGADRIVAAGYAYNHVSDVIDLTSVVLDITHSDADAVLMGQEILGFDEAWFNLDRAAFDAAAALGDIAGAQRTKVCTLDCPVGQPVAVAAGFTQLTIPKRVA